MSRNIAGATTRRSSVACISVACLSLLAVSVAWGGCADTSELPSDAAAADTITAPDVGSYDTGAISDLPAGDAYVPCASPAALEGNYSGTFDGKLSTDYNVEGTVTFALLRSGAGEFYSIETGKMTGLAEGQFTYTANLVGTVKCGAMDASIIGGSVVILGFAVPFQGKMSASLVGSGFPNGAWNGKSPIGVTGSGTWETSKQ